ncbi:hypothetical protein [Microbacterium sp. H83]|uniref:hypothetical protein n=1 Tax=Microbacterium sp. H83 TaxID=1827324 RepID=UPI000A4238D2|nr:hypothetical protein [Microbacterium sp. H83]
MSIAKDFGIEEYGEWLSLASQRNGCEPLPEDLPTELWALYREGAFVDRTDLLGVALAHTWVSTDYPERRIATVHWRTLFSETGFCETGVSAPSPLELPPLFRAAAEGHELGMSWTDDRGKAEVFLDRNVCAGRAATLLMLEGASASRALAHIHSTNWRDENEWVIDTAGLALSDIEILRPLSTEMSR